MGGEAEKAWQLPEPTSVHEVRVDSDTTVFLRRHGNPSGPRLVLSHGNGLAIDLYYPYWSLLTDEFDLIVYDLRNHGWNAVTALEDHNVPKLISDHDTILDAIDLEYGEKAQAGVFHSLSALVSLLSPVRRAFLRTYAFRPAPVQAWTELRGIRTGGHTDRWTCPQSY